MRWRQGVQLVSEADTYINDNGRKTPIAEGDVYIISSLIKENQSDEDLIRLVMDEENLDEVLANWRMAEFVEKYGQWIDCVENDVIFPI